MEKLNLSTSRVTPFARTKHTPVSPGHEHHTQIDGAGTGTPELTLPDSDVLADRAVRRAVRAERNARRRARKAGKNPNPGTATESTSTTGTASTDASKAPNVGLLGGIAVPTPAKIVPPGETRETYAAGQLILKAADGMQELMMARMFDGFIEDRFRDMTTVVAWGVANGPAKKLKATTSLSRNLAKLQASYKETLPKVTRKLAAMNPKAPLTLVAQKAAEVLDQELASVLFMFNIYAESIKQVRDGLFTTELNAVEVFFEDAFQLYFAGDMHCTPDGKQGPAQLPSSVYSVGDVFMPRVTSSGLATVPGAKGPVGANALQLPFEMLGILAIVLPLLGHEARHNVFHDVKGLEEEISEAVEKAIRAAHAAGIIKFEKEEMQLGGQTVKTIDLVVKLFIDWLGEIDADVVGGVLFSGISFGDNMVISFPAMMVRDAKVSTKVKFIRTDSAFQLHPQPTGETALVFEEHPIDYIRIYIVAAAMEEIGFPDAAKKLRELADFAVGDELPKYVTYKDAEGESDLVIKFATADLLAVAPVVAKAIIRTPLKSQLGKSCGDLVMWNAKRQAKVDTLTDILAKGSSDLPTNIGSIFATYVGAAAAQAYLKLVREGTDAVKAATLVNGAALKMIAGLRDLPSNQCPVPQPATPASSTK
jgi:hypothetical protein